MKEFILPIGMILISVIGLIVMLFLLKKNKNKEAGLIDEKAAASNMTVQEFINVEDIQNIYTFTRDGYIISYIKVQPISIDLLNKIEKKVLARKLTDEFSSEDSPFKFLAISRPVDITPLINEYVDLLHDTADPVQKELLRNEIRVISDFSLSGEVVQREFYYMIWEKETETAEKDLRKRAQDLCMKLNNAGLKSEILKKHEIIRLCNMVNNPAFATIEDTNIEVTIPFLNEGKE